MENKDLKPRTYLEAAEIYRPENVKRNKKQGSQFKEEDNESFDVINGKKEDVITLSHVDIGFKNGLETRVVVEDFSLAIKRVKFLV